MEEIKKTIKDIFYFVDPDIKVDFQSEEKGVFCINLKMKDPQVLIGEKGQTLLEIERLLKIVVRKKIKEPLFINLDINDYKKRKADYLKELALEAAEEVSLTGTEKKFPPMSAFERRIIHITLVERNDIVTESIGEEEERRVLIKKK
jgi:spoIIIJ-associated protein